MAIKTVFRKADDFYRYRDRERLRRLNDPVCAVCTNSTRPDYEVDIDKCVYCTSTEEITEVVKKSQANTINDSSIHKV